MRKYGISRFFWRIQIFGLLAAVMLLLLPAGLIAGDHWLSGVTVKTPGQPDTILSADDASSKGLASLMTTSSTAVFDITISLDTNPQGDDDASVDAGAMDAEQRAYERRIREFAKAVYKSTNGTHKIGKVTFFRQRAMRTRVDVRWSNNCPGNEGPRAHPSGFGVAGRQVWMCTNWPGSSIMSTDKGGGYTLAHEWGHYTYGLYDEYAADQCDNPDGCRESVPLGTDTATSPSIMNNQWNAARGNSDYLKFSTQDLEPFKKDSEGTNAQKRVFGESAWETLTRSPKTDPKFSWLPKRTQYTTLTQPKKAADWITDDTVDKNALAELDIRWVGDQVVDLSIDVSGSMGTTPMDNAKSGARLLVDYVQPGSAIGVSSFASSVVRNFPITQIDPADPAVTRNAAKNKIDTLSSGGMTAMYDGLMHSLVTTQNFDPNRAPVVYLLSDGMDNQSSATESSVIAAYRALGVPIISFAYGSFAPTGPLLRMANATGGSFFQSPTTEAEIQASLIMAEAQFSDNVLLSSARKPAAPNAVTTREISLDSTLRSVRINLNFTGNFGDLEFKLLKPNNTDSGIAFTCEGSNCRAELDETFFNSHGYGDYALEITNKTGSSKDIVALVSASPKEETDSFDIAVGFSGQMVDYPANLAIYAAITRGVGITGLDVVATVTDPSGNTFDVILSDDGHAPGSVKDSGIYSASIPYDRDGIYRAVVTASNPTGDAKTTLEGVIDAPNDDGPLVLFQPEAITENFVRIGSSTTQVAGVLPDDHANDPRGGGCTVIFDDNSDIPGRIDYAGDVDCFFFIPGSTAEPLVMRVYSLSAGMEPELDIYNSYGTTLIGQVDATTSENPDAVSITFFANELDSDGHVISVRHADPNATEGSYHVSVGAPLTSDPHIREIQLLKGWNLISPPVQPVDPDREIALRDIVGEIINVWTYDNGNWRLYDPLNPGFSDPFDFEAGVGYYFNMDDNVILRLRGWAPPRSVDLVVGWNLVGYTGNVPKRVDEALGSIDRHYFSAWGLKDGSWQFYHPGYPNFSTLDQMAPNYGYWINVSRGVTWKP